MQKSTAIILVCALAAGCSGAAATNSLKNVSPKVKSYEGPMSGEIVAYISGERPAASTQPSLALGMGRFTIYDGGLTEGRKEFAGFRGLSPFDDSPNDVVSHAKGSVFEIDGKSKIDVAPEGVKSKTAVDAQAADKGGRLGWIDEMLNTAFKIAGVSVLVVVVLLIFPGTREFLITWLGRAAIAKVAVDVVKTATDKPDDANVVKPLTQETQQ
ncbi:MAG: hypothetical protein ABFD92_16915 [Planctomycetaceae bacterium]|nr:hypothetical protein [Planctomycetaceae bacterium]